MSINLEKRMTFDEVRSAVKRIEYLLKNRPVESLDPAMLERLEVYRQYLHQVECKS